MRRAFIECLLEIAASDDRVLLLTADLGFNVIEPFQQRFPGRYFNVGVSEQNLIGVATGLAEAGHIPFVYSIAPFAALRPYEFIRNGPVAHHLPVRIVGVGGGVDYGPAGFTHFGLEEIGTLRLLPGLGVFAPADRRQLRAALLATWDTPGPCYYRVPRGGSDDTPGLEGRFEPGRLQQLRAGRDLLLLALGNMAGTALQAAHALEVDGIDAGVALVSCVAPAPRDDLLELLAAMPLAVTVEAHYVTGGLASLVAETIAAAGLSCRLLPCGFREPPAALGEAGWIESQHGLDAAAIAATARAGLAAGR